MQLGVCLPVREEVEAQDRGLPIPILERGCIFSCYTTELAGEISPCQVTARWLLASVQYGGLPVKLDISEKFRISRPLKGQLCCSHIRVVPLYCTIDDRMRVWRRQGEWFVTCSLVEVDGFGNGSVMAWAGICLGSRTDIYGKAISMQDNACTDI